MDVKQVILKDFTGGLNLADDEVNLRPNEVPDCLDVDFLPTGGFRQRRGQQVMVGLGGGLISFAWMDRFAPNVEYLMYSYLDTGVQYLKALNQNGFANIAVANVVAGATFFQGCQFKDKYYVQAGAASAQRVHTWDGTTYSAAYGVSYNDNLAAPSGTNFPCALLMTSHQGYMWAGYTYEVATIFAHRLRFSHPGNADNWRTNDYIDINPGDGDQINAILPFGDRLLVFKSQSIWAVYGYSPDTFQVVNLSTTLGAPCTAAVCTTDFGVAFITALGDVMSYDGTSFHLLSGKLGRAAIGGTNVIASTSAAIGWGGQERKRLWCCGTLGDFTYVWDPLTSAWTRYNRYWKGFVQMRVYNRFWGGTNGTGVYPDRDLAILDQTTAPNYDTFGVSATVTNIGSYVRTAWLNGGTPAVKKRWRRAEFLVNFEKIAEPTNPRSTAVSVYRDWENTTVSSTFNIDPATAATDSPGRDKYVRGNSLGSGRAVSLKMARISSTTGTYLWGVDQLVVKYVPRELR